jgi:hypothetical protein
MAKYLVAVTLATVLWMSRAEGQSILQRSDWQETKREAYLSSPVNSPPWLNLGTRTKSDFPLGGDAGSIEPVLVRSGSPQRQASSNGLSHFGIM